MAGFGVLAALGMITLCLAGMGVGGLAMTELLAALSAMVFIALAIAWFFLKGRQPP